MLECHICLTEYTSLTFEHVPPRAAFNDEPAIVYGLDDWLARDEHGEVHGGRVEQRGAGLSTLCEACNNNTGSWYGNELARAARSAWGILRDAPLHEFDALLEPRGAEIHFKQSETGPYPLRLIKQIVVMMLATSPSHFAREHPELPAFVLNREATGLPERYRFYLALFAGPIARTTGVVGSLDITTGKTVVFIEVAFPPFAYVMTVDEPEGAFNTCDITPLVDVGYNQRADLGLQLLIAFGHTPFPGDYRTKAMIEAERQLQSDVQIDDAQSS